MENTILLENNNKNIEYAVQLLKNGKVVGIPTETVYGLGADALNAEAVKAVFEAKGRPADNPLIVHISNIETVKMLAHDVPELFYKLAEKFWPGPLTMIVPKNDIVPKVTSGGLDTVGIRMSEHPVMRKLIDMCGPIAAPSANTSGYPSPTSAGHVMHDMNGRISAVIDGGNCNYGVESTVVCFDNENTVRILRPGSVTKEQLQKTAPCVIVDKAVTDGIQGGEKVMSPGMKYKHYSPEANVIIIEGTAEKFFEYISNNCGKNDYCLLPLNYDTVQVPCQYLTYGNNSKEMAHSLYEKLRELDRLGAENVFAVPPEKTHEGLAVYNRLLRAAGFEVIRL